MKNYNLSKKEVLWQGQRSSNLVGCHLTDRMPRLQCFQLIQTPVQLLQCLQRQLWARFFCKMTRVLFVIKSGDRGNKRKGQLWAWHPSKCSVKQWQKYWPVTQGLHMGGWLLPVGLLKQQTESMTLIIGKQSVKNQIYPLVPTCFLHDLADVSEQQSCPSLFADWQEPTTKKEKWHKCLCSLSQWYKHPLMTFSL